MIHIAIQEALNGKPVDWWKRSAISNISSELGANSNNCGNRIAESGMERAERAT
jgi:hypothetical protein